MIYNIPKHWTVQTLGQIAEVIMGQAPNSKSYNEERIGIPLIAGAGDFGQTSPNPNKHTTQPTRLSKKGDIILCVRATIGDLNWADKKYCYGRGVAGIRVKKDSDPEFIFYWLVLNKEHLLSLGRGATFKQISKENILKLITPNPPISDQRRIVGRIKACMERIEEIQKIREENAGLIQNCKKSTFIEFIKENEEKGNYVKLGDVCQKKELTNPKREPLKHFRYIDISSVSNKTNSIKETKVILGKDAPSRARKKLISGDIIFATTRPYLKSVAIVPEELNEAVCSTGFCVIRSKKNVRHKWLFYNVLSDCFLSQLLPKMRGANYPAVTDNDVFSCEILLPPIDIQDIIIDRLDQATNILDKLNKSIQTSNLEIENLKNSILRKAFSGEW